VVARFNIKHIPHFNNSRLHFKTLTCLADLDIKFGLLGKNWKRTAVKERRCTGWNVAAAQ